MIWWKKNHQQIWEPPDGIIFQYSSHQGLRWGDVSRLTWDSREFSRLRGHWEKGLGFFGWDENSLNMWVFTGLQLSSTDNFCLKLPSKLVSKVILKQKNINSSTPSKVHFHPPKNVGSQKSSSKILENRLGRNRFALFIGSIHWTSMVNQQLQSFLLEAWRFHGLQLGMQQSTWFNGSVFPGLKQWKNKTPPLGMWG